MINSTNETRTKPQEGNTMKLQNIKNYLREKINKEEKKKIRESNRKLKERYKKQNE